MAFGVGKKVGCPEFRKKKKKRKRKTVEKRERKLVSLAFVSEQKKKESEKRGAKETKYRLLGEGRRPKGLSLYSFCFFVSIFFV